MKEIPCIDIKDLKNEQLAAQIKKLSGDYKKSSILRNLFFMVVFIVSIIIFGGYLIEDQSIGVSCCFFSLPFFAIIDGLVLFFIIGSLYLLIDTFKILFTKNPHIARRIFITDNVQDSMRLLAPGSLEKNFTSLLTRAMERSFFKIDPKLRSKYSIKDLYSKGAVLAITPTKAYPICVSSKANLKPVSIKKRYGYVLLLVKGDVIALLEKKDVDKITSKMNNICPHMLGKTLR
jgi:hypothetical protein